MPEGALAWAALIVSVIGGGGLSGYAINRLNNKTTREKDWYDQLQDDRDKDRERLDTQDRKINLLMDYVEDLRQHISEGKPPPPPKFPDALRGLQ